MEYEDKETDEEAGEREKGAKDCNNNVSDNEDRDNSDEEGNPKKMKEVTTCLLPSGIDPRRILMMAIIKSFTT